MFHFQLFGNGDVQTPLYPFLTYKIYSVETGCLCHKPPPITYLVKKCFKINNILKFIWRRKRFGQNKTFVFYYEGHDIFTTRPVTGRDCQQPAWPHQSWIIPPPVLDPGLDPPLDLYCAIITITICEVVAAPGHPAMSYTAKLERVVILSWQFTSGFHFDTWTGNPTFITDLLCGLPD